MKVASQFAPYEWMDFPVVADGVAIWDERARNAYNYSFQEFRPILASRLPVLKERLSRDRFEQTIREAMRINNESVEKNAERLQASGATVQVFETRD